MRPIARTFVVAFLFTIFSLAGGALCQTPVPLGTAGIDVPPYMY